MSQDKPKVFRKALLTSAMSDNVPIHTINLGITNSSEIVRHNHGVHEYASLSPLRGRLLECYTTGVARTRHVARNHSNDQLRQARIEIVSLNYKSRATLRCAQVRIRK